jgi:predicted DNA-binding transcriptional regulator YafY
MRRADRLFQIAQYLRGRRLTTARQLADWLSVSERTIYRDVRDLSLSGVPVEGEAGIGYRIKAGFDLQPLMFSPDEIDALVTALRMVQAWGGPQLAASGAAALAKITLALPREMRAFVDATALFAPDFHIDPLHGERLEFIRKTIGQRRKLDVEYGDVESNISHRMIWPLALYFFGGTWLIAAWCELRQDFRSFRLDRIRSLAAAAPYPSEEGKRLADYVRAVQVQNRKC